MLTVNNTYIAKEQQYDLKMYINIPLFQLHHFHYCFPYTVEIGYKSGQLLNLTHF